MKIHTLKVFPTYKAGIDIYVGERDGAEFLEVKVQHTPDWEANKIVHQLEPQMTM